MLEYLYNSLVSFRKVFLRHRTWLIFTIIVLGFIGCSEMVGVTSFCRFWLLDTAGATYDRPPAGQRDKIDQKRYSDYYLDWVQ